MLKGEVNIANIFLPFSPSDHEIADGFLVGFNYEGFLFVIVAVVPLGSIPQPADPQKTQVEVLDDLIRNEPQLTAMNTYCAGELIVLGVIEQAKGKQALQIEAQNVQFKVNQNIWLKIEIGRSETGQFFHLKDLIVCEYQYKVLPHFIMYPRLGTA